MCGCQGRDMGQGDNACAAKAAHLPSLSCEVHAQNLRTYAVSSSQVSTVLGMGTIWGQCHPVSVTVYQSVPLALLQGVGVHQELMHPLKGAMNCPCMLSCHQGPFFRVLPHTGLAQLFAIPMLAASLAGQTDSAHAQLCSLSSGSCPAMCTCSNGIVDCRGKGLTAIPANLPETMTEM